MNLYDENGNVIGPATAEQIAASNASDDAGHNGGILIDADGDVIKDGSWDAQQPGVRKVYTDPVGNDD